jgi:hypothetical protein
MVLVKVPRAQTHSCSVYVLVVDRGGEGPSQKHNNVFGLWNSRKCLKNYFKICVYGLR